MLIKDSRIERIVELLIQLDNEYSSAGNTQVTKATDRREANEMLTIKELAKRNKAQPKAQRKALPKVQRTLKLFHRTVPILSRSES
ncbi:MAG: hypothetical protein ACI4J7_01780 [Ruminiclostridium sp.]